jgi:multiple sugar transport system substrate-binding protein
MMKRNLLIGLLATLLVASLSAFAMAEQVTIRYFMWDPEFQQMEAELIRAFEAENPNIKVEMTALDPTNFWPRLAAMAAAGELPDVFSMSTGYIDTWARDGLLMNIQHLVDRDLNLEDYFYNVFDEDRFPNKETSPMYAIPYAWVGSVLFYNKDMFDAVIVGVAIIRAVIICAAIICAAIIGE